MWCNHVVLTLKSGWNWHDVTIQTKYPWRYFLCFSKLNFEFLSYFEFGHILNWKVFFFFFFLGSGKGEALITVIANHIPRDKKQDVDEEQQFWTSVLQKRVEEKTLAQSEWKVPKNRESNSPWLDSIISLCELINIIHWFQCSFCLSSIGYSSRS